MKENKITKATKAQLQTENDKLRTAIEALEADLQWGMEETIDKRDYQALTRLLLEGYSYSEFAEEIINSSREEIDELKKSRVELEMELESEIRESAGEIKDLMEENGQNCREYEMALEQLRKRFNRLQEKQATLVSSIDDLISKVVDYGAITEGNDKDIEYLSDAVDSYDRETLRLREQLKQSKKSTKRYKIAAILGISAGVSLAVLSYLGLKSNGNDVETPSLPASASLASPVSRVCSLDSFESHEKVRAALDDFLNSTYGAEIVMGSNCREALRNLYQVIFANCPEDQELDPEREMDFLTYGQGLCPEIPENITPRYLIFRQSEVDL